MDVNETTSGVDRSMRLRRWIAAIVAILAVVALFLWFIFLPWLLRNRVVAALRDAGIQGVSFHVERATPWGSELTKVAGGANLGISKVGLEYSLRDLWNGRLAAIHLIGGRLELSAKGGNVDVSPLTKFIVRSPAAGAEPKPTQKLQLPARQVDLTDSTVAFTTDRGEVDVPIDVTLKGITPDKIAVAAQLGPERNFLLNAAVDTAAEKLTFEGSANSNWTLLTVRTIWPGAQVGVDGTLKLTGSGQWGGDAPNATAAVQIVPSPTAQKIQPNPNLLAKLTAGSFIAAINFGDKQQATLNIKNVSLGAAPDLTVQGITGDITFNNFSPLATPIDQKLTVQKLTKGSMVLTDGQTSFQMISPDTFNVRETRWNWLGGELFAQGVRVHASDPIAATVQVRDIDLNQLLAEFSQDKATGQGKLTGFIPVTIAGSKIDYGDGRITAISGGTLQIKDRPSVESIAQSAAATIKQAFSPAQVKDNIVAALMDFQFDKLTAQLSNENGKLVGYVRINGHGRTGAKQAVDYELRVSGIDLLLRAYLTIENALPHAADFEHRKASP